MVGLSKKRIFLSLLALKHTPLKERLPDTNRGTRSSQTAVPAGRTIRWSRTTAHHLGELLGERLPPGVLRYVIDP
jgi:hypothetical protein